MNRDGGSLHKTIDRPVIRLSRDILQERKIPEEWVSRTLNSPEHQEIGIDGNVHYIKAITEYDGRFLREVLNPMVMPNRIVTVFFTRRLRRQQ